MKQIQLFVALLAVSIFVIPAMSMQDNGNAMRDCKPQFELPQGHQQYDCPNAVAGLNNNMMDGKMPKPCEQNAPQGKNFAPKSMMDGKMPKPCEQNAPQGKNFAPKSMMDGKMPKPCEQNAPQGKNFAPKSMMDGKMPKPCEQDSEKSPVGNNGEQPMTAGGHQTQYGQNPEKGPVGDNGPRSMMDNVVPK
ncbi:MAG: hypothetical protein PHW87_03430 [Methanothrix sp.]|nr:hypothetical protein [Methanothrix sp.]